MNTRSLLAAIVAVLAPAMNACAQSGPAEERVWIEPASEQARTLQPIAPADDARPSDEVEARLLAAHNRERAQANSRPLIWRGTTHVGCAVASRGDRAVLACRYSPPGNIDGRRP